MKFRTEKTDGNTPRNILEEIIWWVGLCSDIRDPRKQRATLPLQRWASLHAGSKPRRWTT